MNNYQIVTLANGEFRRWGRQALTGNWGKAILATLIFTLLTTGPMFLFKVMFSAESLDRISNLYTLLVGGPLTLGYVGFMIGIFRRKNPAATDVLQGFEYFIKALMLMVITNVFVALWSLLFVIPGIIAAFRYSMVFYIMKDNPDMGVMEIIAESKRMMTGNKMKFFLLQLSFIGWVLVSILTFGLGFIVLLPYAFSSFVGFYEVARGALDQRQSDFGELPASPSGQDKFDF